MKNIAVTFVGRAKKQLECLAFRRNQTEVECIRDALSTLSTVLGLMDKDGLLTVHTKHEILKFAF